MEAGCSELVLTDERERIFEEESENVRNHLKEFYSTGANYVIPLTIEPHLSEFDALKKAYAIETLTGVYQ